MGKKDEKPKPKPVPKPPTPTVSSSDNDVISASSSHDDATLKFIPSPPPKPTATTTSKQPKSTAPTVVAGLPALSSKRPSTTAANGSEKKPKKLKSNKPDPISTSCWTNDHDIILLKGLLDYKTNNDGIDPMSNIQHLFDFIKPSFNLPNLDKGIIVNKVQLFKSKFRKPHSKKHPSPHDTRVLDLSTLIWGRNNHLHAIQENDNKIAVDRIDDDDGNEVIHVGFGFSKEEGVMLKDAIKGLEGDEKEEFIREVRKANVAYLDAYCSTLKLLELAARKICDDIRNDHF